jgi:ribosomal protein S4
MGSGGQTEDRRSERLDVLLVKRDLAATREKARRMIMAGEVAVDGILQTKPGTFVSSSSKIELRPVKGKSAFATMRKGYARDYPICLFESYKRILTPALLGCQILDSRIVRVKL